MSDIESFRKKFGDYVKFCWKYGKSAYLCTVDSATQREIGSVRGLWKSSEEKGEDSSSCGFSPFLFLFICMIQDNCYMAQNIETGVCEFYDNWTDMAKSLGVTRQYVCRCRDEGIPCKGYMVNKKAIKRIYLVRTKDNKIALCLLKTKERYLVNMYGGDRILFKDVEDLKDFTYHCKNGKNLVEDLYFL